MYQEMCYLFKQLNCIWNSSCKWGCHLIKFMMVHYHSPTSICCLHRPSWQVKWGCGRNHHSYIFQVLGGGSNLFSPSRNYIIFYYFCMWRQFQWFPVGFSYFKGQGTNVEILSVAMYVYFHYIIHARTGEITIGCVQEATELTVR